MPEIIQFFRDRLGPEPPFDRGPAFFLPRPEVEATFDGPEPLRLAPRVPRFGADDALDSSDAFELRGLNFLGAGAFRRRRVGAGASADGPSLAQLLNIVISSAVRKRQPPGGTVSTERPPKCVRTMR